MIDFPHRRCKYKLLPRGEMVPGKFYRLSDECAWWYCVEVSHGYHSSKGKRLYGSGFGGEPQEFTYKLNHKYSHVQEAVTEGPTEMTNQLYIAKIGGNEIYGYVIGRTRDGKKVFEERGGQGAVFTVDQSDLEEVFPYTVNVKYLGGGDTYSFFAKQGEVEEGDIIFSTEDTNPIIVTKLDSKNRKATKWLTGSLIKADKVLKAEEDS